MIFDWTFNVGHLFTILGTIGIAISIYYALRFDVKVAAIQLSHLGGRMLNVENELRELAKVTATMAEGSLRTKAIEDRLTEQTRRLNNIDEHGSRQVQNCMERLKRIEDRVFRETG